MSGSGRITGPLPKDPAQRARGNKDTFTPLHIVEVTPTGQPELPAVALVEWHKQTRAWWDTWKDSPLTDHFTDHEWNYLIETAFVMNQFWEGNFRVAGELRLRAAKFGVTPEDRARLRIQVVTAEEVEDRHEARKNTPTSRKRYTQAG